MSSRKLTRSLIVGAAAIAVAGGSYGIVSATSSSSPAAASSSSSASSRGFAHAPGPAAADPMPGPARPQAEQPGRSAACLRPASR